MKIKTLFVMAAVLLIGVPAAFANGTNLLTNGGFETGDFSGWETGGQFDHTQVVPSGYYGYSTEEGAYYAALGAVGGEATLSQSFGTVSGQSYIFSFWFAAVGDPSSDFSAYWNGTQIYAVTTPDTGAQWTEYSFTEEGGGHDSITFLARDVPAYMALDNVIVSSGTAATPEPASFLLLGSSALGLAGFFRRKLFS